MSQFEDVIKYKRARFNASLPKNYLYTPSHFWLFEESKGQWKIGMTKFAVRMLGELVEFEFELEKEQKFSTGDIIGWIEGFKANSDLYAIFDGKFCDDNPELIEKPELLHAKPHREGWLYRAIGEANNTCFSVDQYIQHLDATIDKLEGQAQ